MYGNVKSHSTLGPHRGNVQCKNAVSTQKRNRINIAVNDAAACSSSASAGDARASSGGREYDRRAHAEALAAREREDVRPVATGFEADLAADFAAAFGAAFLVAVDRVALFAARGLVAATFAATWW